MSANRAREIFMELVAQVPPEQWQGRLAEWAGEDPELHRQVARLLAAHGQADSFLEQPAAPLLGTADDAPASAAPGEPPAEPRVTEQSGLVLASRYKLLEQIGEGGMGSVWMAQQTEPVKRLVAVKLIKPGMDSKQVLARFGAERQALALMDHPHIAKVLDGGAAPDGRPFFVMELVKGVPITKYCDEHRLTPRQRLELLVPVCQAIQHAHHKGIIHRDIKPGNVLVALYDDKPVPKVIDFGVAKATGRQLTEQTLHTGFAAVVGTVEYMSPEQASFNQLDVDTRSDIYSLGVLLYELLAGSPPFTRKELEKAGMLEMLRVIREQAPSKPSTKLSTADGLPTLAANRSTEPKRLTALVRGELDWIVMKALEKDRSRRYETANGFAMDLQRYLADEPVQACPPSAGYRLRKFARRNMVALTTAALVAAALLLGTAASTWQALRATAAQKDARLSEEVAQDQKRQADGAKEQAEKQRDQLAALNDKLRRASYIADMNLTRHAWDESNLVRTRELLEQHRPKPGETDLRGFEWHYLDRLFHSDHLTLKAHDGMARMVAYTPDGKRLVSCGTSQARRAMEFLNLPGEVKLWDAATGRRLPLRLQGPTEKVMRGALSPDGKYLAGGGPDQAVRVWDLQTGEFITLQGHTKERIMRLAFSSDGKHLVSVAGLVDGPERGSMELRIWDLAVRKPIMALDELPAIWGLPVFSPDGKQLAVGSFLEGIVKVWDTATGREAFSCKYGEGTVAAVAYSPDGKRLAACGERGIRIWDVATHESVASWQAASSLGGCMVFSPDGKGLATGGIEGVLVWDTATGQQVHTFKGHAGAVDSIAFSPDGRHLASAGFDGTLRVWDTTGERVAIPIPKTEPGDQDMDLSPDGQTLVTVILGKTIRLWNTATGEPWGGPIESQQKVIGCNFTSDGKRLVVSDASKNVQVWDIASGKEVRTFPVDAEGIYITALSSTSDLLERGRKEGAFVVQ